MAQRVLVTGADGFIGSHVVEALARRGHTVRGLVLYNSFNSWGWLDHSPAEIKAEIEVLAGDVRDPFGVREAVRGCDIVLHLAALISIPYSYRFPASFVETNVTGTLNVVQAVRDEGRARVVCTSTSEVYGTARFVPITEDHPLQPQSPYSATKISADQIALSYHAAFGTPVSILRPFNTYGPRQSARAVIPTVISQILAGNRRVRLGATHPTRDFSYIDDTVRAFVVMAEREVGVGQVINVGGNFETSIGDLVKTIAEVMDVEVEINRDHERVRPQASEVERLWADNTRAKELLGWTPEFTGIDGLRRGLTKTVEWFKSPSNQALYKPDRYNF